MYFFESDYVNGCLPQVLEALTATNADNTVGYGCDPYCVEAARRIKEACKAPEANVHFLVGGTQTNTTVIAAALRPHQGVLCAESGHINAHETGAV
ncbi:MAG: low specificity L-threonine aldolase, partial [Oscillospiraceae bacterium]|nr:low specificity L-threonine aldolase [Oscillospiraceae bacterium]